MGRRFPRDCFLRALCAIYAAAFASIGQQIHGLYGVGGLEPVDVFLDRLVEQHELQHDSTRQRMWRYPTLVWLYEDLQWSPSFCMQVLAFLGMTVACLGVCNASWRTILPMAVIWTCYLSIVQCGQTFMRFQWDSFLLEVGFLAIWLTPWWPVKTNDGDDEVFQSPASVVWTLRFLFFKFMLMSGAVKIQSRCPTWLGLTALEYHFATQPLPLPLSWYAHQLPPILNRLGVAATLLIEGPWTFFIIAPPLSLRQFSAAMQILLQVMIMLTGNYNFFNILTTVMAFALLDIQDTDIHVKTSSTDSHIGRLVQYIDRKWLHFQESRRISALWIVAAVIYCGYSSNLVFSMGIDSQNSQISTWEDVIMSTWIRFIPTVEETQAWLTRILPVSFVVSVALIGVATMWQLIRFSVTASVSPSRRVIGCFHLLTGAFVSAWVFCACVFTLSVLGRSFQESLPPFVYSAYTSTSHFRVTSPYGLFRTMTGVGTIERDGQRFSVVARPEIIVEGTDDGGATWKPYHFRFKPGDISVAPRLNVPFQPRLDWQMWFAALGDYQGAPWIVHLVYKLLNNSSAVKELLDPSRDPFPTHPPAAIRAQLYLYDYTRLNTTWNRAIPNAFILKTRFDEQWWTRTLHKDYTATHFQLDRVTSKNTMDAIDSRKCHNCGNTGHLRRDCPEAPSTEGGFNSGAACFGCGKFGHLKRDCPSNVGGGRACHNCGNFGHLRRDCPEEAQPPKCHNCGQSGHLRRDCTSELRENRKCHGCGQFGHLRRDCPEDNGGSADKCYQCGGTGHWARDCTNQSITA
ncbi:hypothetical protein Poli38472_001795 [Pythium oligandrum]|uniref:Lipase maturation factor 2 n=1 Tax=Pythium oligandrum TaxID=41045 RepID=A0A8K1CU87_PYTOL|nr:hypothetical protein Poli38472_001795 [Pythium oligandrum]|eukprot:TMW69639.1 hypothetical protein Poli38472_001795 [Pythium oligandrum]